MMDSGQEGLQAGLVEETLLRIYTYVSSTVIFTHCTYDTSKRLCDLRDYKR